MLKRGIRVGLATDGVILGGSLDLFRQMAIAHHAHVATYGLPFNDPAPITQFDLLKMSTIGGAKALSWDDEIGSIEKGKKADLVLISREELDILPAYDPVYAVASHASASQVKTVLVDGKIVMKDGKLVHVDEDEIKERVKERAPEIISRFLKRLD
jgi:cytosine/adenosine deaminase-related metal-dependent hydrolase